MTAVISAPSSAPPAHWRSPRGELGAHVAWYTAAGVVTTLLQAALYLALRGPLGAQVANLVAIAITTIANTEFHRRITFAGSRAPSARRYVQTLLTFVFYAGYGAVVLAVLDDVVSVPSPMLETTSLAAASLVGGALRFFVLRGWVFARR
jgi:putative flippase GtrA